MTPYCARIRMNFDDYHDEELSPLLHRLVAKHLDQCDPCREEYAVFVRAISVVRRRPAPDVPPHVLRQVVENLTRPKGGSPATGLQPGLETP